MIYNPNTTVGLNPCPDCNHQCSRYSASCPSCGRLLQDLIVIVNPTGWVLNIAYGVILAGIIVWIIGAVITFLFFVLIIGGAVSQMPPAYNR